MSSPVIPREKLSAYQRWELNSFDGPQTGRRAAPETPRPADNAAQLHDVAYRAGLAEGMRRGALQAAADVEQLRTLIAGVAARHTEDERRVADEVLSLALEIARQMTRRALRARPELVVPVIQDALAHITQPAQQATLTLHPEDARLAREHLGEQLGAGGWRIAEDPAVARGGCTVATAASHIDASTATRWRQVVAALGEEGEWLE